METEPHAVNASWKHVSQRNFRDDFLIGFGGVTPLHLAVMNGHLSVVTVLVSNGAKLEVRINN